MIQAYALVATAVFNILIGIPVLRRSSPKPSDRMYLFTAFFMFAWVVGDTLLIAHTDPAVADLARRVFLIAPIGIVSFLVPFALLFPNENSFPRWVWYASFGPAIALGLWMAVEPRLFIASININYPSPNTFTVGHPYYEIYATLLSSYFSTAYLIFYQRMRRSRALVHLQAQYTFMGVVLSSFPALITNLVLPILGYTRFVWVGPLFSVVYIAFFSIAIIRYRLFDIRHTAVRALAYLLTLTLIVALYVTAIMLVKVPFAQLVGNLASNQNVFYVCITVVAIFCFDPLKRLFNAATRSIFFRKDYDSQEVLNRFSKILVSELNLERILKRSLTELCESVHIQFGQLIIFNRGQVYRVEHFGPLPQRLMVAPELHTLKRSMLIADELSGGARKVLMESHGVRVSMMLSSRDEFVGYLLLGDKLSGDIYSNQDIELLEIISKELAVAIQNAKAYAEISEFNVTLQARVDHATNRLRVANRHLKELDKAKDEFISMASHQLRTPLTTIKGYLSMLGEGDAGPISDDQKQFVQYAFDSSERMVRLISDLLNVSRLSAGKFLIQTRPTDMVAMIDDEVRQLEPHAKAKNLNLVFERPKAPLPPAQIDDNKTRQVIMNFIDNAIYYTPKGEVRVKLSQTGEMVRLEVTDTGIGVPADARRKLFTKFYRAGNAQTVRPDGTGLGLYLAKRVIQDQGGTIIFNSVEGKGSTFGFELPLKPAPIHTSTHHEEHNAGTGTRPAVHQ
jgi:signal transduction histidine kinase